MEQSQNIINTQSQPYQQNLKPKKPIFVMIISWFMLLSGIQNLLLATPFLFLGSAGKNETIFGLGGLNLIMGIGLILISFGMRNMRRWALYSFTTLTVLVISILLYSFTAKSSDNFISFANTGIQTLTLIYCWTIYKKFT